MRLDTKMLNTLFGSKDLFKLVRGELKNKKGKLIRVPDGLFRKLQDDIDAFSEDVASYYFYN